MPCEREGAMKEELEELSVSVLKRRAGDTSTWGAHERLLGTRVSAQPLESRVKPACSEDTGGIRPNKEESSSNSSSLAVLISCTELVPCSLGIEGEILGAWGELS